MEAFKDLADQSNLILLASVAVLGIIGLFGGWNSIAEKKTVLQTVAPKEQVVVSPFKMTFSKGFWFQDQPEFMRLQSLGVNERGLMATVDVTNTSLQPVSVREIQTAFRTTAEGLTDYGKVIPSIKARPTLVRGSDFLPVTSLQPGLKMRLVLIWVQQATQPIPQKLQVVIYEQTYRKSALDGSMQYFDPTPLAQVDLPITHFQVPK